MKDFVSVWPLIPIQRRDFLKAGALLVAGAGGWRSAILKIQVSRAEKPISASQKPYWHMATLDCRSGEKATRLLKMKWREIRSSCRQKKLAGAANTRNRSDGEEMGYVAAFITPSQTFFDTSHQGWLSIDTGNRAKGSATRPIPR